ncbi:MAG: 6-bladed beta-propeller [Thermoplasmata archaeon]|nr:6-bladed beta-propeller [Thermoplasmata archaeon]
MKNLVRTLFFGICFFSGLIASSENTKIPYQKLKLEYSFPSEKEDASVAWLAQSTAMARTSSGQFLVCNNKEKTIVRFSSSGKYMMKFGRPGQGPGDFLNILGIIPDRKRIIVFDSMKHEISFFSDEGKFIQSIKLFNSYRDIAFDGESRFYALQSSRGLEAGKLIDVLDEKGSILLSFGEPINHFGDKRDSYLNAAKVSFDGDSLALVFTNTALVRRYGKDGKLLNESMFKEFPKIREESRQNIETFQNMKPGQVGYRHLFDDIEQSDGHWYLLRNSRGGVEIIEMEKDLKSLVVYTYKNSHSEESVYMDFKVSSSGKRIELDLLMWMPESRVDVMVPAEERR